MSSSFEDCGWPVHTASSRWPGVERGVIVKTQLAQWGLMFKKPVLLEPEGPV